MFLQMNNIYQYATNAYLYFFLLQIYQQQARCFQRDMQLHMLHILYKRLSQLTSWNDVQQNDQIHPINQLPAMLQRSFHDL